MASTKVSERKRKEIEEAAWAWGKLVAQEAFPDGPGQDVTLADMEEIAALASQAVVRGAMEVMAERQAQSFQEPQPCPTCGQPCQVQRRERTLAVRGGKARLREPVAHCSTCRRAFFPSAERVAD